MLKVLFVGTGEFAVLPLKALMESNEVEVVGIVTQPDKPIGRSQELQGGPVKQYWQENYQDVSLFQPEKLRIEAEEILDKTSPDLIIVAAYGQMVPDIMLQQPEYGAWNLHGSLLPELRGAVPVQRAILDGLDKTGVTIQQMVKELDAGDILTQKSISIAPDQTSGQLMGRLSILAAEMLIQAVQDLKQGKLQPRPQIDAAATYCYQSDIAKEKAEITFDTPVVRAERMVRGFNPWPVAWFTIPTGKYEGKRVKVYDARISAPVVINSNYKLMAQGKSLLLQVADGVLQLLEIQLEGKDKRPASDYLYLGD